MKKLPALLLCALLFVGVVPAGAYAETTAEAMANLYDKVYGGTLTAAGEETLGYAYSRLGAAVGLKNWVDGHNAMVRYFELDKESPYWIMYISSYAFPGMVDAILEAGDLLSYEGLWKGVKGSVYYSYYDWIGPEVKRLAEAEIDKVVDNAEAEADRIEAEVLANTAAAQASMQMFVRDAYPQP